jgi:hypothetical protein
VPRAPGFGIHFLDALPEDGERRLMLAVLMDAIRCLCTRGQKDLGIRAHGTWLRDRRWFQSDEHSDPFSFVNICDALGIDAGYVRRCVLHPSDRRRVGLRYYAAAVEESWLQQSRSAKERSILRRRSDRLRQERRA